MKNYKSIMVYLIIAFAIPLLCIAIMCLISQMQSGVGYFILFGFAAISPTAAGLFTVFLFKSEGSLKAFLKRCFVSRFNKKYFILALVIPLIEIAVMQALLYLTGSQFASFRPLSFLQFFIVSYSLVAEEIGWRGFLQNRLEKRMKPYLVPVLTGIVWGLWHYHFYLIGSMSYPVYWFFIGCIADSIIYYWITRKSNGNILPATLLHFSYNFISNLFFVSDPENPTIYSFFVVGSILVAAIMIFFGRAKRSKKVS